MSLRTPDDVVRAGFCSGCGLCEAIAAPGKITMQLSAQGYLRPRSSAALSATEAEQFRAACPGIGLSHPARAPDSPRHTGIYRR